MPKYITRRIVYQPQARMEVVVEIQEQLEEELEYKTKRLCIILINTLK